MAQRIAKALLTVCVTNNSSTKISCILIVDVSNEEGVYEVECPEGVILLGKTIPSLPYTNTGNLMLGELGFQYGGDQRFQFPTQVSPALPAKADNNVNDGKMTALWSRGVPTPTH